MERLTPEDKAFVLSLCKDPTEKRAAGGFGGPSVFNTLFGDNPKVGDKITLEEAFNKTYKGKATLDVWVRRWADKGQIVEVVTPKTADGKPDMMRTTYTIKELPSA